MRAIITRPFHFIVLISNGNIYPIIYSGCPWQNSRIRSPVLYLSAPVFEYHATQCHGRALKLTCLDLTHVMHVTHAMYGRADAATCSAGLDSDVTRSTCSAPTALDAARAVCDGRSTCTLEISRDLFGQDCPDVSSYLDVKFVCGREYRMSFSHIPHSSSPSSISYSFSLSFIFFSFLPPALVSEQGWSAL
jgi:hypothetical protein